MGPRPRPDSRMRLWLLATAVAAVAVYANALDHEFVLDDVAMVRDDPRVRSIAGGFESFVEPYWGPRGNPWLYRPAVVAGLSLGRAVHGPDPWGFTAVNVVLHAAVAVALAGLARTLGASAPVAGAAGLLFAVHPVHTEAVDAVVGRSELQAALFVLLALLAHVRSARRGAWRPVAAGLFLLAVLSKENGIAFAGIAVAMDWLLPSRDGNGVPVPLRRRIVRDYGIYAAAIAAYLALRWNAVGAITVPVDAISPLDNPLVPLREAPSGRFYGAALGASILTRFALASEYARLLVWPARLSCDYSFAQIPLASSVADPRVLFGGASVAAAVTAFVRLRRRLPLVAFGVAFVACSYSIVGNVVTLIGTILAERLVYLPSAGLVLACTAAAGAVASRSAAARRVLIVLLAAALGLGAARTWSRNPAWRTDRALWESAVSAAPASAKAHAGFGRVLREDGERTLRAGDRGGLRTLDLARSHLETALEIFPDYVEAMNSLALTFADQGEYDRATLLFARSARLVPDHAATYRNWGAVLSWKAGAIRQALADEAPPAARANELGEQLDATLAEALIRYDRAIELEPSAEAHYNRGALYYGFLGQRVLAARDFEQVLRLRPDHPERAELERAIREHGRQPGGVTR